VYPSERLQALANAVYAPFHPSVVGPIRRVAGAEHPAPERFRRAAPPLATTHIAADLVDGIILGAGISSREFGLRPGYGGSSLAATASILPDGQYLYIKYIDI
jgi:hypothetical protein